VEKMWKIRTHFFASFKIWQRDGTALINPISHLFSIENRREGIQVLYKSAGTHRRASLCFPQNKLRECDLGRNFNQRTGYRYSLRLLQHCQNASCGMSTLPMRFIRFLPSFFFEQLALTADISAKHLAITFFTQSVTVSRAMPLIRCCLDRYFNCCWDQLRIFETRALALVGKSRWTIIESASTGRRDRISIFDHRRIPCPERW